MPPRGFTFAVKLVRARADVPEGSIAREIGGLGAKLKSMFRFNDYALIDSVVLRVADGGRVETRLGDEFVLAFTVKSAGMRQRAAALALRPVPDLPLRRRRSAPAAAPLPFLDAGDAVADAGRRGVPKEESSKSALILILLGQEVPRGDAPGKGSPGATTVEKKP